jgi:hypothetical protein
MRTHIACQYHCLCLLVTRAHGCCVHAAVQLFCSKRSALLYSCNCSATTPVEDLNIVHCTCDNSLLGQGMAVTKIGLSSQTRLSCCLSPLLAEPVNCTADTLPNRPPNSDWAAGSGCDIPGTNFNVNQTCPVACRQGYFNNSGSFEYVCAEQGSLTTWLPNGYLDCYCESYTRMHHITTLCISAVPACCCSSPNSTSNRSPVNKSHVQCSCHPMAQRNHVPCSTASV